MGIVYVKGEDKLKFDDEEDLLPTHNESDLEEFEMGLRSLPYLKIFDQYLPFEDSSLKRLVPGCSIRVSVRDIYSKDKKCWLTIDVEHGCYKWVLRKRFRDLIHLHRQLLVYRTLLTMKLPEIKFERDPRKRRSTIVFKAKKVPSLPSFPIEARKIRKTMEIQNKMADIEGYLQSIMKIQKFRVLQETMEFLEIGPLSFIEDLGPKNKEGYVWRRCGYRQGHLAFLSRFCINYCPCWKKRWLFIKENFVGLINPSNGFIDSVILLDTAFKVSISRYRGKFGKVIVIQNLSSKVYAKCENEYEAESWVIEFNDILDGRFADFVRPNRFGSFAPPRPLTECRWIIDGATYFEAVAEVLNKAKEEIFISDWWLSPEIYLKRPVVHGHYWQLDYLLRRKARAGVKIYVLLYKELSIALGINSLHTSEKLMRMHRNIKVIRHPEVSQGVWLWAHHEKIVCVDQTYAFVGGIDLCYGRWDDYQHRLCDIGKIEEKIKILRHMSRVPAHSSTKLPIKRSSSHPLLHEKKEKIQKVPTKQVAKAALFKTAVRKIEVAQRFEQIKRRLSMEAKENFIPQEKEVLLEELPQKADRQRMLQEIALLALGMERKYRLWHGKDYANFISKDFEDLDQPYSDIIDRSVTPRMPWHDVGLFVQGRAARDVARHFILRWNQAKRSICPSNVSYTYLLPKSYANFGDNVPPVLQETIGTIFRAECQVLRSLSLWSGRIKKTENSIHQAYIDTIREAKHFLYIENQFFITQPEGDEYVFNGISDALYSRIIRAHRKGEQFHVFVNLPLLPAFEGSLGTGTGTSIQAITYWNYKSVCRGPSSLYHRLSERMKDPSLYITFSGLRTHGFLGNRLVTEILYVHSKIMIADDQVAIIGSANINDRSLLGSRDSEVAIIVKDTQFLEERNRSYKAGKFCFSLRTALFREHLGMMQNSSLPFDLGDPSTETFVKNIWQKTAKENTRTYEEVFHCFPSDAVKDFAQLRKYQQEPCLAETNTGLAQKKLENVRGYLVEFPFYFLIKEYLQPTLSTKEHFLPTSLWT